jgi:prevent-host-death family protein
MIDKTWQLQDAKAQFSEVVERAAKGEPQIVTKHGQNAVVIISYAEYATWKADHTTLLEALCPDPGPLEDAEADVIFKRSKSKFRPVELG